MALVKRSIKELAKEAKGRQGSKNLCIVVQDWARSIGELNEHALEGGHGTDWVNEHPITKLWAEKVEAATNKKMSYLQAEVEVQKLIQGH